MLLSILDAANVYNCGEANDIENSLEECNPGFGGLDCHEVLNACLAKDPCLNDGVCRPGVNSSQHRCECPLGFTGDNCEYHKQLEFSAHFNGDSYLEVNRAVVIPTLDAANISLAISITTNQPNGLLLWFGQSKGELFTGQDFLALAIVDGFVEYSFRLNSEEGLIRNTERRVDDNNHHVIIVYREGSMAKLEIDSSTQYGESRPTTKKTSFLPGNVFLGKIDKKLMLNIFNLICALFCRRCSGHE